MTIKSTAKEQNLDGSKLYKWYTSPDGEVLFGTSPPDESKLHLYLSAHTKKSSTPPRLLLNKGVTHIKGDQISKLPIYDVNKKCDFDLCSPTTSEYSLGKFLKTVESNIQLAEKFFQEVALKDEHLLKLFMEKFPKTDLHMHLDGSIHSRQLLNMAVIADLYCRVMDDYFEFGTQKEFRDAAVDETNSFESTFMANKIISARELQQDTALREKFYEIVSMRGVKGGGKSGHHKHFFKAFNTLESIAKHIHLKDKLTLLLRNTNEHVRYLEPSIWFEKDEIPVEFEMKFTTIYNEQGLTVESVQALLDDDSLKKWTNGYVAKVKKILNECKAVTDNRLIEKGFSESDLFNLSNPHVVRFIIDNDRTISSLATVFAHFVGSMTLEMEDDRVVGSGFAGEEYDDNAINHYDDHMNIIKVLKHHFSGAKLSLHAGELNRQLSQTEEPLQTNVRKAVMAGADRIGHGVSATDDPNWLNLFDEMKKRDVHVECCLKSNENVLGITNGTHPISWFISKGVSFSLCTDDQGVNNSSPASEMLLAAQRYNTNKDHIVKKGCNLGYKQLKRSVINSIRKCFLNGESIYKKPGKKGELVFESVFQGEGSSISSLRDIISLCLNTSTGKWNSDILSLLTNEQQLFIKKSEKAQMQLEIEKEFIYFEQFVVPGLKQCL